MIHTDLSKKFGTILPGPFLSKTKSLWFSTSALNLLYMKNMKQKAVINNKTRVSEVVRAGVLQGSIDRPLLFNLLINDLI